MTAVHETNTRRLSRPRDNRWIAGVCSGLARRFGLRPDLVRLLFVLSCLLPGPQFIIYLMLWAIIPAAPPSPAPLMPPSAPKQSI